MINKLKKMKLIDWWHLIIIILCYIPGLILKFINRNIWIISENGNDAKDNGFYFFKHMMKKHPEIKCYYVITKDTNDYEKVKEYPNNLLIHNSLKDIIYTIACKNYISSQLASSFPYPNIFFNLYMKNLFGFNYIFLQHGITKENVKCFNKEESNINLFCCAANPEYEYVKANFGYKDYEVAKVGFCRYDNLDEKETNKDSILFMPTWRKYLETEEDFLKSKYYKSINNLINDKKLISSLEKNNKTLYFCLHDNAMIYKKFFKSLSKNIKIVDKNSKKTADKLIKECAYLITDISSVAFDFAYQNKRILYYNFDYDEIVEKHWERGYFDPDKDGFGKVVDNHDDCVKEIISAINEDFSNEEKYIKRTKNFYSFHDKNNCERTHDKINEVSEINSKKRIINKRKAYDEIMPVILFMSLFIMIAGTLTSNYIVLLFGCFLLLINNFIWSLIEYKKNIYFILFNFSIFTFLLSRPLIQTLSGIPWWEEFSEYTEKMALISLWLTLLSLFIGAYIIDKKIKNNKKASNISYFFKHNKTIIKKYSFIFFIVSIIFEYICEIEKYIYMLDKSYTDYYLTYSTSLPSIITLIGGMAATFMIIYLVCLPKKRNAAIVIILYAMSMVVDFIIGQRNPLVLSVLFGFSYFLIRDYYNSEEKWIYVKERILIIIMLPLLIIFLNVYNYTRSNEEIKRSIGENFVDFFYTQGVSYNVLNIGFSNMDRIRSMEKNYVFGPIVDYFENNTIAKKIFHLKGLGTGNNKKKALEGNSFTHILSYLSKEDYLEGHGYGSSYILELFCNYGFLGLTIFSILLGGFLISIPNILQKQNLLSIVSLMVTTSIYFLPRAETMSSFLFIFTPHFWGAIILILIVIFIIKWSKK